MGLIRAILRKVKDDPTRLDVFSPNRLKRRPLEMPNRTHHHALIKIATAPFRAGALDIICGVPTLRRFATDPRAIVPVAR